MLKGYWLHCAAIGGLLVAVLLTGECCAQTNAPSQPAQAQQQQNAPPTPPIIQKPIADSADYTISCDHPKDHDAADLCEQRRQAGAAEDSVWWARFQTYLGILGAILVLCSLWFTGWAAVAAARAAKAAEAAVNQEEEREAPFVYPVIGSNPYFEAFRKRIKNEHPTSPWTPFQENVGVYLKNFGRSPALLQNVCAQLVHLTNMSPQLPISATADTRVSPILEVGKTVPREYRARLSIALDREAADSILARQSFLYLIGRIEFGSVNGTAYEQTFCLAYSHNAQGFVPWGAIHNRRKRKN